MVWSLRYQEGGNRADYDDRVRLGVDKRSMRRLLPKGSWSQIRRAKRLSLRLSPVPLGAFTAWREDSSTSQARFDRHQLRCIIMQIGCDGRSGTTSPVANSTPGPRGGRALGDSVEASWDEQNGTRLLWSWIPSVRRFC
ncbi:hypothetical protein XPA_004710 [Xanthoria parietina]